MKNAIDYPAVINWVLTYCYDLEDPLVSTTLQEPATKEKFFEMLLEMDCEVQGGTFENPLWLWMTHPWFKELKITEDECYTWFDEWNNSFD